MTLAGALGSDQREGARGPISPAVDEGECGFVARSAQKIGAIEAFPMAERKAELVRRSGITHYTSSGPEQVPLIFNHFCIVTAHQSRT
jgi:hypothetical protein